MGQKEGNEDKKHQKQAENAIFELLQLFELQLSLTPRLTKTASEVIGATHQSKFCFRQVWQYLQ